MGYSVAMGDPTQKGAGMGKDMEPVNAATVVGYDPTQFEWEQVKEEAPDQVNFTVIGDTLVADYLGMELITFTEHRKDGTEEEKSFYQLKFRTPEGPIVVNGGYELVDSFKNREPGVYLIQLAKFIDVGQASPMKSYRIHAAKPRGNS